LQCYAPAKVVIQKKELAPELEYRIKTVVVKNIALGNIYARRNR
jgi:hypothetical protein